VDNSWKNLYQLGINAFRQVWNCRIEPHKEENEMSRKIPR
ncbi:hypothetical protein TNCT_202911, partial [Trichonephila clavata]